MISFWRIGRKTSRKNKSGEKSPGKIEVTIPNHFLCPISLDLMNDPITLCTGITYDRQSIDTWLDAGNLTCPVTNQVLENHEQVPNHALRKMIQDWCVLNSSNGFVRIPTPRVPATPMEVERILSEISSFGTDPVRCRAAVKKLWSLGKESERNRKCIAGIGIAGGILSSTFEIFAKNPLEFAELCEEILGVLTWLYPLDSSALAYLGSPRSLGCLAWFLGSGNLAGMKNAVLAVKEVASSSDVRYMEDLGEIEGFVEALVCLIKSPICPSVTKASLATVFHLASSSSSSTEKTRLKIINANLIPALFDSLIDSDRGICESSLAALDALCNSQEGREKAYENALAVPVLVKKIFRVSELATEFAVSALWKLCKNCDEEWIVLEALQVGAFQKLLLLLQVGCAEKTKEKASNLLKMLNSYRNRFECVESMDFKGLKRTFL